MTGRRELLAETLAALDGAGLRYCLLRGSGIDAAGQREIDLLLDAHELGRFERVMSALGFGKRRSWGHGGHRFYFAFDPDAGEWLKLDVVTSLRYGGRRRPLASRVLTETLARRVRVDETWRPDPVDAVLGLVLHGTLDKRTFKPAHRLDIGRLREVIEADPLLRSAAVQRFQEAVGGALSWSQVSDAVTSDRWAALLARRRRIAWELLRRAPLASASRWVADALGRLIRPAILPWSPRGFSVALLGPDGAGKTTLARALAADPQFRARVVYMGMNPSASTLGLPTSRWITRRRRAGQSRDVLLTHGVGYIHRLVEQMYRSVVAFGWRLGGEFVVFDRHPSEAGLDGDTRGLGPRLRRWLLRRAAVHPDLVLVLDAPPPVLLERTSEQNRDRLERQRMRLRALPGLLRDTYPLDASDAEEIIVRRAKQLIWNDYRRRASGETPASRDGGAPVTPSAAVTHGVQPKACAVDGNA